MESPAVHARPWTEWMIRIVILAAIVVGVAFIGLRAGQELLGPSPLERLDGEIQQLQTTSGTFVGRISSEGRDFVVLDDPATVTAIPSEGDAEGDEFLVQMLATDPYGIDGPLLVRIEQVIIAGEIAPSSKIAGAYREASGQAPPESSPSP